jgi:hypothetical protein
MEVEPGGWLCIRAWIHPCRNASAAKGFSL